MTRRGRIAFATIALLACAAHASADYRVNYQSAILAIDGQRWSEAVLYLNQALKENATEGMEDVLITGNREEPYLPLYYLGLAYYKLGDCARATGAWQLAKMSGAVEDYPKLMKTLKASVDICDKKGSVPEDTTDTDANSAQKRAAIAKAMRQAESDLKAKRFAQARRSAEQARTLGADPTAVDAFLGRVTSVEGAPVSPTQRMGAEREALLAFYSGDYGRVEQLLGPLLESNTLTPRGHLYLACSYAASALLRGREPQSRLQRARDIYKQALTRNANFAADWKFISPRLREALEGR